MTSFMDAWFALVDSAGRGGPVLQWGDPWWLLFLIPVAAAVLVTVLSGRARPSMLFSRGDVASTLPPTGAVLLEPAPRLFMAVAAVLLGVALARPQLEGAVKPQDTDGIDVVIALDLSTSMRAADFKPKDRLFVAKEVISDFIMSRTNDRIGLVVFAREAFTQSPLTLDYMLLRNLIQELKTGVIDDGTAIGNGLAVSLNRLRDSTAKSRLVILVTDGDNNAGQIAPEQAADIAKEMGVKVFPILVGRGGKVPYPTGQDLFGNPTYDMVDLPVNPALLQQISNTTSGQFYTAVDRDALATSFKQILDQMERSKLEDSRGRAKPVDVYPLLMWPALLLILLAMVMESTRLLRVP